MIHLKILEGMLKFMKKRNFLALVLALALTLGLAAPAMAANPAPAPTVNSDGTSNVTVKVIMNLPTIKVTIGAAPQVVVNPYELNYDVNTDEAVENKSIVSAPVLITSQSAIDLNITATPTGSSPSGDVVFATTKIDRATNKNKEVFLFLDIKKVSTDEPGTDGTYGETWADDITTGNTAQAVVTLGGSNHATYKLERNATLNQKSFCAFKLSGNCAGPDAKWAAGDEIGVSIAFTFEPTT